MEALLGSVQVDGCELFFQSSWWEEDVGLPLGAPDLMEDTEHKKAIDLGMFTF